MFTMTVEKVKAFATILLVSGYVGLPKQEMYWERPEDCHNLVVSAMMAKNEFLECKRYLHLADNNALNTSGKFAKVRTLFNAINEQCILNYQPNQYVDKSMVPYFGKHEAKQYIHGKPIKFGFKLWVIATPLEYFIRFRPWFYPISPNDSILPEYENIELGLGVSLVVNLVSKLPVMQTSNYHFVMDNYITSLALLRHLSAMEVAATGMVRAHRVENAPLWDMVKMNKGKHGSSDVFTDVSSNITEVCWKDNKVVNAISTFTGKQPIQQVKLYCHREKRRVNIEQPNIIN